VNGTTKVVDIEAVLDVEYDGRVVITQRPPVRRILFEPQIESHAFHLLLVIAWSIPVF
jgi:hypothetical protein